MAAPANRGPAGPGHHVDVSFASTDGTILQGRHWAHSHPRGLLMIAHGLGEHGGSYRRTIESLLQSLEIDVLAFDFRGSGRSPGSRGVIGHYREFSHDLEAANRWAASARPGLPRFLLGHSNGGLVALRTVLDGNLDLAGLIVSNPSLKLLARVPGWKRLTAEVLRRFAPTITLTTGLSNDQLTRDPDVMEEIASDSLRHSRISSPLYFGMIDAGPAVIAKAAEFRVPILMIIGGSDPVVDPEVGQLFFEAIGSDDKTLRHYPEMRHEPLNELGREVVIKDMVNWLNPRLLAHPVS